MTIYLEDHPYCFRVGGSSGKIETMIKEKIPFCVSLKYHPLELLFFIYEDFPIPKDLLGVVLKKLPCHLGGFRYEFVCPVCRNRYRKMYLGRPVQFVCRKCIGLSYRSKSLNKITRLQYAEIKLYKQYSVPSYVDCVFNSSRPIGMHRKTFSKFKKKRKAIADKILYEEFMDSIEEVKLHNKAYPQCAMML